MAAKIALICTQFSANHTDRLRAVDARLPDRAEIISVEVASRSTVYDWVHSAAEVPGMRKVRLFEDRTFGEAISARLVREQINPRVMVGGHVRV